jgi:hypothetical protein
MRSSITIQVDYEDDSRLWRVGAISRTDGQLELAATEDCGPFCDLGAIMGWVGGMMTAWAMPPLSTAPSESLHDAFASHP